jgi:triosephosphate isomerase
MKLLAANWKENPKNERAALALFNAVAKVKGGNGVEIVVCPPFIYLESISEVFKKTRRKNLALGAQDVFWEEKGAYTSEVGPKMLRALGTKYVIVGHSERRKWLHETDEMINKKIKLAARDGLNVILCVGEALAVRRKGMPAVRKFVKNQLQKDLKGVKTKPGAITIAYEPIWAIGTGKNDTPQDAVEMAVFIKEEIKKIKPKVLYGGSVNKRNVADFVQYREVDGALVGGASLKAKEFSQMISLVGKLKK